jgi:hypothetical protein
VTGGLLIYNGDDGKHAASTFIGADQVGGKEHFLTHLIFELLETRKTIGGPRRKCFPAGTF